MRALNNRIIVKFNNAQKEKFKYGSLELYIPNRIELNSNERETQPNMAEVIYSCIDEILVGDLLVFGHTVLNNRAFVIEKDNEEVISVIPINRDETIYGKLDKNGDVIPLFGNVIVERFYEAPVSSIIITPDAYKKYEKYFAKCIKSHNDYIRKGATVYYYKFSDYELVYNVNGIEKRIIIVKKDDIVGSLND